MKRIGLFVCFAIIMANIVSAQAVKKYEGEMRYPSDLKLLSQFFGTDIYNARLIGSYYYYENQDGERVKHGVYQFYFKDGLDYVVLRGQYLDGQKTGEWIIKDSIMAKERIKKIEKNNLKITYENDDINGPCQYAKYAKATFTNIKCNFNNRVIVGDVVVQSYRDTTRIREYKGFVSDDGLLHGIWTIRDKGGLEMLQKRMYYKGGLVSIEESDFSTGDKYMCYCAFNGMTKTPNMEDIKDTIVNGLDCIIWNGQIAVKDEDRGGYNSKMSDERLSNIVFYALKYSLYSTMQEQQESWDYKYSVKSFSEKTERIRKERERFVQDSIRKEQQLREEQLKEANTMLSEELLRYINIQPDKKIKKSSIEGNVIVFQAQPEVFRGEFKEEYMKNSMGEIYPNDNRQLLQYRAKVLSNKACDVILLKFEKDSKLFVYLIHKNGQKTDIYEVTQSAFKGLPIEW